MNVKIFRRLTCLLCLFLPSAVHAAFSPSSNTADKVVNKNIETNEEDQKTADTEIIIPIEEDYTTMPFPYTAFQGDINQAKLLKANINAKDKSENKVNENIQPNEEYQKTVDTELIIPIGKESYRTTCFLCVVIRGNLNKAKKLREKGANTEKKDSFGNNALHLACAYSGSVAMVTWLLDECKLSLEPKGHTERAPFNCAAQGGHLEIAKLLKSRGANVYAKDKHGNNALHWSCIFSGSVEMVTWLLDVCKIGIETKGSAKRTPFLFTAERGQLPIAKLLRERGANINAKDKQENNALHLACAVSGSEAMVTWLLDECKIGIETKGCAKRTPFLFAAEGGQLAIAKLLKKRKANIHAKDKQENNALHWACAVSGSVPMVTWLLDVCNIGLESKNESERTPFLLAAEKGQFAIAKLLKECGANINAVDKYGNNALELAPSENKEMATWLSSTCGLKKRTWFDVILTWLISFI